MLSRVAHPEDALAWGKSRNLHMRRQDLCFVVVQQFKEGNVSQFIGIAGHLVILHRPGWASATIADSSLRMK
jgi:hypothetical protein